MMRTMIDGKRQPSRLRVAAAIAVALAGVVCLGMAVARVAADAQAFALDLDAPNSMTVSVEDPAVFEGTPVSYRLYKVADAVPVAGEQAYTFEYLDAFASLASVPLTEGPDGGEASVDSEENDTDHDVAQDASPSASYYARLAQSAAALLLADEGTAVPAFELRELGSTVEGLDSGMYLIVVTDADGEPNFERIADTDGEMKTVSVVQSDTVRYLFAPQLVSVPTKDPVAGTVATSNPGPWIHDAQVLLKYGEEARRGDLLIEKTLTSYHAGSEPVFVFQVNAYESPEKRVLLYSDVVSLTFTAPGTRSVLLEDKVPVCAYVEVSEIYAGAEYKAVGEESVAFTLLPDVTATARFTNAYGRTVTEGGGIDNVFTYEGEDWSWSQR